TQRLFAVRMAYCGNRPKTKVLFVNEQRPATSGTRTGGLEALHGRDQPNFDGRPAMNGIEILIDKILAGSRLADGENRRDVAAELRSHLEDSMNEARRAGYDDEEAERFAVARFGSPRPVSQGFSRVYRFERVSFYIVAFGLLIFAS